ncbi:MAG: tautomerase family protein [Actinomycetota bacterium]
MPFYHALVRPGLLTEEQRQRFAVQVVDVHCDVTGAPPSFVHALITEDDEDRLDGQAAQINGTIRAGRTDAQKAEIADRLSRAMADVAGVEPASVRTSTRDIQASYTMEGGALLPEPGSPEEQEWRDGPPAAAGAR